MILLLAYILGITTAFYNPILGAVIYIVLINIDEHKKKEAK